MKLRTTLVLFLLSFALVGCYSLKEPLTRTIQTLIADDELGIPGGSAEAEVPEWLGQAKGPPTDAERDAFVQADKERVDAQLEEDLSEEEVKEKLEAAKAKAKEEAKVKLEAERKAKAKAEEEAKEKLEDERKAKEQAEEEAKIKIAENILKLKALNSCVNCNLSGASLKGADLRSADLRSADFSGADLSETDLSFAKFSKKVFVYKVDKTKFHSFPTYPQRANLKGVNFTDANLEYARLSGVNLAGANLTDANLNNASLFYTNFRNANLTGATLKDAKIEGAIFCNTKTPWGLDNSGCKKE